MRFLHRIIRSCFFTRPVGSGTLIDILDRSEKCWTARYDYYYFALDHLLRDIPELAQAQHVADRLDGQLIVQEAISFIRSKKNEIGSKKLISKNTINCTVAILKSYEERFATVFVEPDVWVGRCVPVRLRTSTSMQVLEAARISDRQKGAVQWIDA